ncbi:MAG: HEAT repeat domain-containing protein, partial [Gammaproteobacteria bacterium]
AAAIEALGRVDAVNYLDAIIVCLKDTDAEVRRAALNAITRLGHGHINVDNIPRICTLLSDSHREVLVSTLSVLSQLVNNKENDQLAIQEAITDSDRDRVIQCLHHEAFTIQAAACTLLSHLNQHTATEDLRILANDTEQHDMARREAINALADLLKDKPEAINNELIKNFSQWILDKSQPVRLAAISNLLKLDKVVSEQIDVQPLEIIISAANGELVLETEDDSLDSSEKLNTISVTVEAPTTKEIPASKPIEYTPAESELDKQPAQQSAMSTLEALSMDNVEMTLAAEQSAQENTQVLSVAEQEEHQEYFDLLEENNKRGIKMKAPKWDVTTDARYLSLRVLGQSNSAQAVNALITALESSDALARHEAIRALGQIANNPHPPAELLNAFGRLVTLMHSDVEDNRLACVQTLGDMKHRAAIPEIINHLSDDDYHVRLHGVYALAKLCQLQIDQGDNDPEDQIVINDMNTDDILQALINVLDDKEPGVKMAAIESLLALRGISQEDNELEKIIRIALNDQGALTKRIAQLLRHYHAESAGGLLLDKMQVAEDSGHRRFIIEMLEELYKPEVLAA